MKCTQTCVSSSHGSTLSSCQTSVINSWPYSKHGTEGEQELSLGLLHLVEEETLCLHIPTHSNFNGFR